MANLALLFKTMIVSGRFVIVNERGAADKGGIDVLRNCADLEVQQQLNTLLKSKQIESRYAISYQLGSFLFFYQRSHVAFGKQNKNCAVSYLRLRSTFYPQFCRHPEGGLFKESVKST